ncbi:amidase domain-containing protein [Fervidibacillus halotolerans]|uniref:Amidase domain-containing protein n=1 Tax=Fervidibacillus halotolerans TaxID=2980027 RepID=A0A9E8LY65_9BACI|nr:amidase domain-containing protein [Fervidibacillus halotolerans]WAA11877.1 amidase domain-containing protein [Fervidibacillus halotolerans]
MLEQMKTQLQRRINDYFHNEKSEFPEVERKRLLLLKRKADLKKVKARAKITNKINAGDQTKYYYICHLTFLLKQGEQFYLEEEVEKRVATFDQESLLKDQEIPTPIKQEDLFFSRTDLDLQSVRIPYEYDRIKAVQYADRWWNDTNPKYKSFENNCTNFISQCLHAGGAPMWGYPNRTKGWWYQGNNWSYSWSVAHALCLYLSSSTKGLRAEVVEDPRSLQLGDVIFYDFQGDGRFDHSTIVTGKDAYGYPLVNAQTTNSRLRYWSYEDSSAYTNQIQYRFFSIVDHSKD